MRRGKRGEGGEWSIASRGGVGFITLTLLLSSAVAVVSTRACVPGEVEAASQWLAKADKAA